MRIKTKQKTLLIISVIFSMLMSGCNNKIYYNDKNNYKIEFENYKDSGRIFSFLELINDIRECKTVVEYGDGTNIDDMDTVFFGEYEQVSWLDGKEDIEWIVLEKCETKALILSKYILDCKQYYFNTDLTYTDYFNESDYKKPYNGNMKVRKQSDWDNSTLKLWLNTDFINDSFSIYESRRILPFDTIDGIGYGLGGECYCSIMDLDTCKKYFGTVDNNGYNYKLATRGTEYALSHGLNVSNKKDQWYSNNSSFWLMDNGNINDIENRNKACFVGTYGKIYEQGDNLMLEHGDGVRPMMWIDLTCDKKLQTIKFGKYEQDNNLANGKEDIEWWIIDDIKEGDKEKVLLISKEILDVKQYNSKNDKTTWEKSDLRKWLNSIFYNGSFNNYEKSLIIKNNNNNERDDDGNYCGKNTYDNVFILRKNEITHYFQLSKSVKTVRTLYAQANVDNYYKNKSQANDFNGSFWLRDVVVESLSYLDKAIYKAYIHIGQRYDYEKIDLSCGVRPVIWIDVSNILSID